MSPDLFSTIISILDSFLFGLAILDCIAIVFVFISNRFRSSSESPPKEHPWALFARQNQLKFESKSSFFGLIYKRPQVTGLYRSHFKLELIEWRNFQKTVLTLAANINFVPAASVMKWPAGYQLTLDDLLKLMTLHGLPDSWRGKISIDLSDYKVIYEREEKEEEVAYLEAVLKLAGDLLENCPQLVTLGGVAVPALIKLATQDHPLRQIAIECLSRISQKTQNRLERRTEDLLCSTCLVYPTKIAAQWSWWQQLSYYGCRQCGQSQQFLELNSRLVIVVLDKSSEARIAEQADQVRVNWFAHTQPFDFDEVEIVQADDEAVERFAVQIGNDTDPIRYPCYRKMRCRIATDCSLSVNTIRILRSIFGEVERTKD